ncbi:hypothetical protein LTR85_002569 [Meristemomyces frigidus]|nr:hypothetical protein LTR85_002569 [Meristemomyces frigidus]
MLAFSAVSDTLSRAGRKRKLPWLQDLSTEEPIKRHFALQPSDGRRQPTEKPALAGPAGAPPSGGFFKQFVSPGGAAWRSSSSSSSKLSDQSHYKQHAEMEERNEEDHVGEDYPDQMSTSEELPAEFLSRLILNMQRSRQLEGAEAALRSALAADDTVSQRRLAAKVHIGSSEQRSRESDLYRLADVAMKELEADPLFQGLGLAFADVLERNANSLLDMEEESDRVRKLETLAQERRQQWNSLVKSYATNKLLGGPEDEFGERLTLGSFTHNELEAGIVYADAQIALEHWFETCRDEARQLYGLAEPILVGKGLLPPRPLANAGSQRRPEEQPPSQEEAMDQKQPAHDVASSAPGDRSQEPITMTENIIRDINQNFRQAYQGLAEATVRLENVRAHQQQDLEHAKQTAGEFGVLPPEQTSDFRDDYPGDVDGDADSDVVRKVEAFNPKRVNAWRKAVMEASKADLVDPNLPAPPAEWPDVDHYEAASLALGASLSTVAVGKMRAKVDRFRQPALPQPLAGTKLSENAGYPGRGFCNSGGTWEWNARRADTYRVEPPQMMINTARAEACSQHGGSRASSCAMASCDEE